MKYKYLLFDADDTVLDFASDERNAFFAASQELGIEADGYLYSRYTAINISLWKRYEKGEITRDEIGSMRFRYLVGEFSLKQDSEVFNSVYRKHLKNGGATVKNAESVCSRLKDKGYSLYIVSNGDEQIQTSRFNNSGLGKYFVSCYFSGKTGYQKPNRDFFNFVFDDIGCPQKERYLIIGDSLSSDIQGGKNAEIDTCYFNRSHEKNLSAVSPDYEIDELSDLFSFL